MIDLDIVCASHRQDVLDKNLCASPGILSNDHYKRLHIMRGFDNVAKAYNAALTKAKLVMYVHEDVYLPEGFFVNLYNVLRAIPEDFGVLGVAGVKLSSNGERHFHGHISDRGKPWGSQYGLPAEVDTLDELLLVTRGDYEFDEMLPLDFYGADICMQATKAGKKNYAINAYVQHNSSRAFGGRTPSFHFAHDYFRDKWINFLPIGTTCTVVKF